MSIQNRKGLITVLLKEEKNKTKITLDFFKKYFNGDCDALVNYILSKGDINEVDTQVFLRLNCLDDYLKKLFEKNPSDVVELIKLQLNEDNYSKENNRFYLTEDVLEDIMLENKYFSKILDDEEPLFDVWWVGDEEVIMDLLDEREKEIVEREDISFEDLNEVYIRAYNQVMTDDATEELLNELKSFFQTNDIKFENRKIGNIANKFVLSIDVERFLNNSIIEYFNRVDESYYDELYNCLHFECLIEEMINVYGIYNQIEISDIGGPYYYPDSRKLEKYFHEFFKDYIG